MTRSRIAWAFALPLVCVATFSSCSATDSAEVNAPATIGGVAETSVAVEEVEDDTERTVVTSATTEAPSTETTVATTTTTEATTTAPPSTVATIVATDEVLDATEIAELESRGWTTPTDSYSCHGTETRGSRRTVIAPDFLNVRIGPGVSNYRILRLAPGTTVYAYTGFDSDDGRPATVTQVRSTPWIMIDIPYFGDAEEPAPAGCGFVSTRYLSSPVAANLKEEIEAQS